MDNCKFKLHIDGHYEEFSSEEELNHFLRENRKSLISSLLTDKIAFSKELNKQDQVVAALQLMSDTVDFKAEGHTLTLKSGPLAGVSLNPVTKFIQESKAESGNKLVPGFNLQNWKANQRAQLANERNGDGTPKYTPEKIEQLVQDIVNRWETQAFVGTSFHTVAENYFNGNIENPDDVFKYVPQLQGNNFAAKKYITELQRLKELLQKRHGKDAVFNTEVKMFDPQLKVGGISDLVVVDKDGVSHIYDYKTSTTPTEEWAQAKMLTMEYQLGFYRQILRRSDYDVGSMNYIPVQLLDLDLQDRVAHNFKMDVPNSIVISDSSPTGRNINSLMPYDFSSKLKQVTSNKEVAHFLKEAFNYDIIKSDLTSKQSVEDFMATLEKTPKGNQYRFKDEMNNRNWHYIDATRGEEFVKRAVASYLKNLDEYNKVLPARFYQFVTRSKEVIQRNEEVDYLSWVRRDSDAAVDTANKLERLVSKYINDPNWNAIQSDALNDLGILAFENAITKEVDFMSITANNLDRQPITNGKKGLLRGSTLLGNFLEDHKAKLIPGIKYDVKNKDIEFLKVYAFIKNNQDIFQSRKIGSIFAVNMYNNNIIPNVATQTVEAIERQWDALMQNVPSTLSIKSKTWKPESVNFSDSLAAYIGTLLERDDFRMSRQKQFRREYKELINATDQEEKLRSLGKIQDLLDKAIGYDIHKAIESRKDLALAKLLVSRAILQVTDTPTQIEPQLKKVSFIVDENASFSNPNKISHLAMRKLVQVVGDGLNNTAHAFNSFKEKSEPMNAALYKANSNMAKVKIVGYNLDAFRNLFELDADGNRTMRFRDPNDRKLKPAEAEYIRKYMDILADIRVRKIAELENREVGQYDKAEFLATPEARNIPLMRASTLSSFIGKDYKEFFNDYARRVLNPNNVYDEDVNSKKALQEQTRIANFFDIYDLDEEKRREKLANSKPQDFESDLEAVLDIYYLAAAKEQELGKKMPIVNALKSFIAMNEHYFFNDSEHTLEAMKNYISTVALGNSLVAGESKGLAIATRGLQDLTSIAQMAISPFTGGTELASGIFNSVTRTLANRYNENYFGFGELRKAYGFVIGDQLKPNFSYEAHSMCEGLNDMFRLSERDVKQLAYKSRQTSRGLLNFRSEGMYWFNTIPGYMNRMVMFTAQAIKDGVLKVNSAGVITADSALQVKNGKVVYNEMYDARFKPYLMNPNLAEHLQTKEWKEARALYFGAKEDLSQEADGLKADGTLARPYTNTERDSMKEFSDEVYGNYDPENKDAWSKTAFGRIINQFKGGWVTAKKNRWYLATDTEGRKGHFDVEWTEDGEAVRVWKGSVSEGIIQSLLAVASEMKNRKTPLVWDHLDPVRKENLTLMFSDLAMFGLFTALLSALGWLSTSSRDNDPLQYQFARSANNAAQDLWIGNTISAFTGQKNPVAMFSWGSSVVDNTWGLVTGQQNAGSHLMNNIGVYRSMHRIIGDNDPNNN